MVALSAKASLGCGPAQAAGSRSPDLATPAHSREDAVNFMVNGVNLNDLVQNQITFQPSINTTSEFKINNQTFSAEYGRSSGSIVNVSTRSGTNSFHGETFEYVRNDAADARNYFNQAGVTRQAPFKRHNFGGALGGNTQNQAQNTAQSGGLFGGTQSKPSLLYAFLLTRIGYTVLVSDLQSTFPPLKHSIIEVIHL